MFRCPVHTCACCAVKQVWHSEMTLRTWMNEWTSGNLIRKLAQKKKTPPLLEPMANVTQSPSQNRGVNGPTNERFFKIHLHLFQCEFIEKGEFSIWTFRRFSASSIPTSNLPWYDFRLSERNFIFDNSLVQSKTNCYSASLLSLLLWLIYMMMPNNISARWETFVRQIQKFRALVTFTCWFVGEENDGISWKLQLPTKSRFRSIRFYVGSPLLCRRGWVPLVLRCLYLMPSNGSRRVLHISENVNWLIVWCKNLINVWYF